MLLVAAAFAETPSLLFPGAAPNDAGEGEVRAVAVGGGYAWADGRFLLGGGQLRAEHALTDRLQVGGSFTALYGVSGGGDPGAFLLGSAAARYAVVRGEGFSLAPYVVWAINAIPGDDGGVHHQPLVGVALEGGGDRVRWDVTVPVPVPIGPVQDLMFSTHEPVSYVLGAAVLSEAGVTLRFGEADSLRMGKGAGLGPSVRYRHLGGPWIVDLEVTAPQAAGISGQLGVGLRW